MSLIRKQNETVQRTVLFLQHFLSLDIKVFNLVCLASTTSILGGGRVHEGKKKFPFSFLTAILIFSWSLTVASLLGDMYFGGLHSLSSCGRHFSFRWVCEVAWERNAYWVRAASDRTACPKPKGRNRHIPQCLY